MKTKLSIKAIVWIMTGLIVFSCSELNLSPKTKKNPDAESINLLIKELDYNSNSLLNVNALQGTPSKKTKLRENSTSTTPALGKITTCINQEYNLKSNFDEVAILRPTNGIIFPGALVVADQELLDGLPNPITLERSSVNLRVDLPGIGEKGTIVVENPTNSTVQNGIDKALEHWNATSYQEGYVNASNSSYQASTSYSSKQIGLDVGLNIEWASGSIASQLNYTSSSTKRVATMVYKQVFYTVTMDTPESPSSVFGNKVSLEDVKNNINSDTPPAYINSVAYGRIIMFRMETNDQRTNIELDAVLKYAAGVSGTGTVNSTYNEILRNSSITVVTIGGNAEVASEAVNATGSGSLKPIITGKNAVYSRSNPGVPIAYSVRFLKDNSFAKLGYTTDFKINKCGTFDFQHKNAFVRKTLSNKVRFRFSYRAAGGQNFKTTSWTEITANNIRVGAKPPAGAHAVRIQFEALDVLVWSTLGEFNLNYLNSDQCFEAFCASSIIVCTSWNVKKINC